MFQLVLRRLTALSAATIAVCLAPRIAPAQCLDWTDGFGLPGNGVDSPISDFAVWDDGLGGGPALYACGDFVMAGGVPVHYVAKWDGNAWHSLAGGMNYYVRALGVHDDGTGSALYASGYFTTAGGVAAGGVARWDGVSWSSVASSLTGTVNDIVSFDDGSGTKLFVAGGMTQIDGVPVANIAAWDGVAWSDVGGGTNGQIRDLQVYDDGTGPNLFACGYFMLAGGNSVMWIAKWDGSAWNALPVGPAGGGGGIEHMAVYDDGTGSQLYAGGQFTFLNGSAWKALARWNGSVWTKVGTASLNSVGTIRVMAVHDDGTGPALYVSGYFSSIGGVAAEYIARWNGSTWSPLSSGLSNPGDPWVYALASGPGAAGSRLWAGGDIDAAGGKPSKNIASWGETCTPPTILAQPTDQTASYPDPVYFTVNATGVAPMTYQWRHNGTPISNTASVTGATTAQLRLGEWSYNDHGTFDVVITNPLGTLTSAPATLTVPVPNDSGSPVHADIVLSPPQQVNGMPPGNFYTSFSGVNSDDDGRAALAVQVNGLGGMSLLDNGQLTLHHLSLDQAHGLPAGIVYQNPSATRTIEASAGGCVVYDALLSGPGVDFTNNVGVWFRDPSATDLVGRTGDQAIGFPVGQVWRDITKPRTNGGDRVAFQANVFATGSNVGAGVWRWTRSGGNELLAASNTPAFGASSSTWKAFSPFVDVNASGEVQFHARLDTTTGFNYGGLKDSGLWAGTPGNLRLQVRSGDPAPGMPAGCNIEEIREDRVLFTSAGEAIFEARIAGPSGFYKNAMYRAYGGVLTPLVLYGDPAPGGDPSAVFFDPIPWDYTDAGDVLFYASVETSCPNPCPSYGLWVRTATAVHPVVMNRQDPLPSAPTNYTLQSIRCASINASLQVVVVCMLNNSSAALYGWTQSTGLFPLAVPGGQLAYSPSNYKTLLGGMVEEELGGMSGLGASNELLDSGLFRFSVAFWGGPYGVQMEGRFQEFLSAEFGPGAAYCFGDGSGKPCPCANVGGAGEGCSNSKGHGAVLDAHGSVGLSDDSLKFDVTGLPFNKPTLLFQAPNKAGGGTGVTFGDGLLCVSGTIKRLAVKSSSASGTASFGPGLGAAGLWTAGQTRRFQAWYRDPTGPCSHGTNLSNAYELTFVP
ncbi:MAG: hypothetical protein IT453_09310 [Planctomycetes bacterium]|nr:hypothetical protein [Planctomycetota bacterium]